MALWFYHTLFAYPTILIKAKHGPGYLWDWFSPTVSPQFTIFSSGGMLQIPTIKQYHLVGSMSCAFSVTVLALWNRFPWKSRWPWLYWSFVSLWRPGCFPRCLGQKVSLALVADVYIIGMCYLFSIPWIIVLMLSFYLCYTAQSYCSKVVGHIHYLNKIHKQHYANHICLPPHTSCWGTKTGLRYLVLTTVERTKIDLGLTEQNCSYAFM